MGSGHSPGSGSVAVEIFTVGHSTQSIEELIELLEENHVRRLTDVRSFPSSKRHPQFDQSPHLLICDHAQHGRIRTSKTGNFNCR